MPSNPHESEASPAEVPPVEAVLIRRAREARGLTYDQAADRLKIKMSSRRWRQLEEGREHGGGKVTVMGDPQLAHMAHVVGVAPERLIEIGKREAAEILREIEHQVRSDSKSADESLPTNRRPVIPSYVTPENTEDWEWEIWANLLLLTPEEKEWIIEVIGGTRRRNARAAEESSQGHGARHRAG